MVETAVLLEPAELVVIAVTVVTVVLPVLAATAEMELPEVMAALSQRVKLSQLLLSTMMLITMTPQSRAVPHQQLILMRQMQL